MFVSFFWKNVKGRALFLYFCVKAFNQKQRRRRICCSLCVSTFFVQEEKYSAWNLFVSFCFFCIYYVCKNVKGGKTESEETSNVLCPQCFTLVPFLGLVSGWKEACRNGVPKIFLFQDNASLYLEFFWFYVGKIKIPIFFTFL